jgi:hypothetical protein
MNIQTIRGKPRLGVQIPLYRPSLLVMENDLASQPLAINAASEKSDVTSNSLDVTTAQNVGRPASPQIRENLAELRYLDDGANNHLPVQPRDEMLSGLPNTILLGHQRQLLLSTVMPPVIILF